MHGFHGLRHYGATAPSGPVNGRSHKGAPQPIPRPPSIPILPPARPPRRSAIAQPVGLPGRPRWSTRSAYNYHYFGHPFAFGQSVVASGIALSKTGSADLWQSSWRKSLPGLLFSPAPGLVWFSPVLVLGLVSAAAVWRDPRFRALIPLQLGTVLLILVAGKWFDWWGPELGLPVHRRCGPVSRSVDGPDHRPDRRQPSPAGSVRRVAGMVDRGAIPRRVQLQPDGMERPVARIRPARASQPVALGPTADRIPPRPLQLRAGQEKAGNGHLPELPRTNPERASCTSKCPPISTICRNWVHERENSSFSAHRGANVKARPLCTRSTAAAGRQGTPENRVPASHFSTGARSSSRLDGQRRSRVPPILQRYAHRLAPLREGIEQRPYVGAELRGGLRQGEV